MEVIDSLNISLVLIWETGKVVLRGRIISYPYEKKKDSKLEVKLEGKIKDLETTYATNPTKKVCCKLRQYKLEPNNLINKKTQFLIERHRHNRFQYKSSKYLANATNQNKERNTQSLGLSREASLQYVFKNFFKKIVEQIITQIMM